jgi:hypothetical protein
MRISTRAHGIADYATGGALLLAPAILRPKRGATLLRAAGAAILGNTALTDWEVGVLRVLPVRAHLALDAATGALMLALPSQLRGRRGGARDWLPHMLVGATELATAALSERKSGDREERLPGLTGGVHYTLADDVPRGRLGTPLALPAVETPGPSVTPPRRPWSETEREEWADRRRPDPEIIAARRPGRTDALEELLSEEESAAGAEARAIGGFVPRHSVDPAMEPVYEAGEGDQEGWEEAERELRGNAEHREGDGNPIRDMYSPELESDRSSAVYGEADGENMRDPDEGPDAPPWGSAPPASG